MSRSVFLTDLLIYSDELAAEDARSNLIEADICKSFRIGVTIASPYNRLPEASASASTLRSLRPVHLNFRLVHLISLVTGGFNLGTLRSISIFWILNLLRNGSCRRYALISDSSGYTS